MLFPPEQDDTAQSPCTNSCALDAVTGVCQGCFRTLDEITLWARATNKERLEILANADFRRDGLGR